jgi:hypothetical protein
MLRKALLVGIIAFAGLAVLGLGNNKAHASGPKSSRLYTVRQEATVQSINKDCRGCVTVQTDDGKIYRLFAGKESNKLEVGEKVTLKSMAKNNCLYRIVDADGNSINAKNFRCNDCKGGQCNSNRFNLTSLNCLGGNCDQSNCPQGNHFQGNCPHGNCLQGILGQNNCPQGNCLQGQGQCPQSNRSQSFSFPQGLNAPCGNSIVR